MENLGTLPSRSTSSSSFLRHRPLAPPARPALAFFPHRSPLRISTEDESGPSHGSHRSTPCAQGRHQSPDVHPQDDVSNRTLKGTAFTIKLEELLRDFKNKESRTVGLRNDPVDSRNESLDVNASAKKGKAGVEESGTLLLNLFSSSPAMLWEADKKYPRLMTSKPRLPIRRKCVLGRNANGSNLGAAKRENNGSVNPYPYRGRKRSVPANVATMPEDKVDNDMNEPPKSWAGRGETDLGRNKSPSNSDSCRWEENMLIRSKADPILENEIERENCGLQEFDNMGNLNHHSQIRDHAKREEIISFFNWIDSDDEEERSSILCSSLDDEKTDYTYSSAIDDDLILRQRRRTSLGTDSSQAPDVTILPSCSEDQKPTWHQHTIPDLPFEFKYSYSEIPNAPILGYRERPYSPFLPSSIRRPWTGSRPPEPTKKKVPEFDSFNPPPRNKKGLKFVQDPGPYLQGQGPKAAKTREEIQGEPLLKEEIIYLVEKCQRENRQLNLGRDGLTHNMLDTIHCHWKRRRVCRIKCKGVPTVDMENVCFQIEDKTGGKIIYRTGGVLYLFRGRNYNYKDRPKIPLMLWKPATPIYPKLIQDAPGGLTKEDADKLRKLGQKVEPMCRIGKNGLYSTLIEDVRNAFKLDDLVRIDCEGLKPTDYKKIGAKLQDLVPCVLLSFRKEHILMWKGKDRIGSTDDGSNHEGRDEAVRDQTLSQSSEKTASLCTDEQIPTEVRATSELSSRIGDDASREEGKDIISSNGQLHDEEGAEVHHVQALWDHAIECGMAIEVGELDMDPESILEKASKLTESAPTGPIYTHGLLKKLQVKAESEWGDRGGEQVQVYFGRSKFADKPKRKLKRRSYQLPSLDVPPMGGLPVDEVAKLLAV